MAVVVEGKRWETVRLGEIAEVFSGFAFKSNDLGKEGLPVIKIANIQNKKVLKDCEDHLPENLISPKLEKYWLQEDDFLIAMTGAGSLGKVGKMRKMERRYLVNQRVAIVRTNSEIADPEFVYQVVSQETYERLLYGWGLGAGQPNVSSGQIGSLTIPFPQIEIQKRIAAILSAYDDLIENNLRRIKILEEMAQTLYREWFIKFRFPGHQRVKMVNSPLGKIPGGWEVAEFRNLFEIKYGKTLPKTEISERGPYPVYGAGDVIGYYDRLLCPKKCALVTSRGNGSGTIWRTREAAFVTNNSLIILPQEKFGHWDYSYVELLLKHSNVMEAKTGSAQPQVTIENLNYVKAIVPPREIVEKFCALATPIYEQVDLLFENVTLRQTRDLLLPKLISGELDVSELDITIPEANA